MSKGLFTVRAAALVVASLAVALAAAACGSSDPGVTVGSATAATAGVDSTTPDTSDTPATPATDDPTSSLAGSVPDTTPATDAPTTTAEPTTTAAPTTALPPAAAWTPTTFDVPASVQGYSGNWCCTPSPPVGEVGEPPADGYYAAKFLTPWMPGAPTVTIRIERLENCPALPAGTCYENDSEPEQGIDPSWTLDITRPLEAGMSVIVRGFGCFDTDEVAAGDGSALADLFESFSADYATAIAPRLAEFPNTYDLGLAIAQQPTNGFVGTEQVCGPDGAGAGVLLYEHPPAPTLLLQVLTDWDGDTLDATELIHLEGVQYTGGVPTFYFYAGFYS